MSQNQSELWNDALSQVHRHLTVDVPGKGSVHIPAILPESLGRSSFCDFHGSSYALMSGAMANGIASADLVIAMAKAGFVGIYGAAGQGLSEIQKALGILQSTLGSARNWGVNLIHNPSEPALEWAIAETLVRQGVGLIEASAYLNVSPALVYYRAKGLRNDPSSGQIQIPHRIIGKVSRVEVARRFLNPAPESILKDLVNQGHLTEVEARLASQIPIVDDLTAEADSGGHTDNQPAIVLFPTMIALRDEMARQFAPVARVRIGAAGGISTPHSIAGALMMGMDYFVTGSVNQACVESGSSDHVRKILAETRQAEVTMAPAADMFEMGVKLQVLKRGTLFPMRAAKLYELYRAYDSVEDLPEKEIENLEKTIFRKPLQEIWAETQEFFRNRDPEQLVRAAKDSKYRMALIFRWYLGQSSRWANRGVMDRVMDFQVWAGPAMAAFNDWARGSFLEDPRQRTAATVNLNLLYSACVLLRARIAQVSGVELPPGVPDPRPLPVNEIAVRTGHDASQSLSLETSFAKV